MTLSESHYYSHGMLGRDDTTIRPNDLTRGPDMSEKSRHPLPDMNMDFFSFFSVFYSHNSEKSRSTKERKT